VFEINPNEPDEEDKIEIDQLVVELPEGTDEETARPIASQVMLQLHRIIEEA
jgi:hypothetical protein